MKPWLDTLFCKNRISCFKCRKDAEFRRRLFDDKRVDSPDFACPPERGGWTADGLPGIGDRVEAAAKPIAKAMGLPCLDSTGKLKPESGCAKRRDALNKLSQ